jgi:hypothetical protein
MSKRYLSDKDIDELLVGVVSHSSVNL